MAGCHDCHTEGYSQTEGLIDPEKELKGTSVGWRGPWGTTYPSNLRIVAAKVSEDYFVDFMKTLKRDPPMPWYNVRAWPEADIRSFYRYVDHLERPDVPRLSSLQTATSPALPTLCSLHRRSQKPAAAISIVVWDRCVTRRK